MTGEAQAAGSGDGQAAGSGNDQHGQGARSGDCQAATEGQAAIFICPERGCSAVHQRYSSLQKHLEHGMHRTQSKATRQDISKVTFAISKTHLQISQLQTQDGRGYIHLLKATFLLAEQWALKTRS